MERSKRFLALDKRPINQDFFAQAWPEVGLVASNSPGDPSASLRIEDGMVLEMDGRLREDFDLIDQFIADYGIDTDIAPAAMARPARAIAQDLVDFRVSRADVCRQIAGLTPARLLEVSECLNVVEMMTAMQKMRARRTPANQCHITNKKDHPALLAADAAEGALRGFAEEETTIGVLRLAPLNALAILVGSQAGRGGVLTQCAVEEALSLQLAMRGLTTYAETVSVYGTESAFIDGDDTPWSKAFLASAYAARGAKLRYTSGTGSEVLMGHAEGKSMLYLEIRCLLVVKAAGAQGVQNGSVSCTPIPGAVPGGVRTILAENLLAAALDLEVASGNDGSFSHSETRKAAKLMLQMLPGTDLICSGYSAVPRADNMFGGGNFDAADFDDFAILQRDMMVDGGVTPIDEAEALDARRRGVLALQAVFRELQLPAISDDELEAAVVAHGSEDVPDRDMTADIAAAERLLRDGITGVDVAAALARSGFQEVAHRVLSMQRQRVSGDYLQTAAIITPEFRVLSAVNDPNDYAGPGSGYRVSGTRWRQIHQVRQAQHADRLAAGNAEPRGLLVETGRAGTSNDPYEVVIALGPAFGHAQWQTISGVPHREVLQQLITGIEEEGLHARLVRIYRTSSCGQIGHDGALLSGSGVAIGMQSKGTTVIHQRDLLPLNNLELFPQAQMYSGETFRLMGRNAARYARGEAPPPIPTLVDPHSKPKYLARAALLHLKETELVVQGGAPVTLALVPLPVPVKS